LQVQDLTHLFVGDFGKILIPRANGVERLRGLSANDLIDFRSEFAASAGGPALFARKDDCDVDYSQYTEKYLNKSMATEPRMLSIVFDRIGVGPADEREKIFKGLVDNSVLTEARTLRAAR